MNSKEFYSLIKSLDREQKLFLIAKAYGLGCRNIFLDFQLEELEKLELIDGSQLTTKGEKFAALLLNGGDDER